MDIEEPTTQTHLLSDQLKYEIIFCHQQGAKNKTIARDLGEKYQRPSLSHQTVKFIIDKFDQTGKVDNDWSDKGRPPDWSPSVPRGQCKAS